MLRQNWFCQPNMEMFYDCYGEQWFYDKNTKAIYVVSENTDICTSINEYQDGMKDYKLYYAKYIEWKSNNMPVKMFLDEIQKFFCGCSDEEIDELYESGTIDISMFGLTTKLPFGAEPYIKIVDALKHLVDSGEVE